MFGGQLMAWIFLKLHQRSLVPFQKKKKKSNWGKGWCPILKEATLCLLGIPEETEIITSPGWWCDGTSPWALRPKILLKTPSLRYGPMSKKMKCKHHSLLAAWSERIANVGHCSLVFNPRSQFTQWSQIHSHSFIFSPSLYVYMVGEASEQAKASRQLQAKIIYTKNILKLNIVLTTVFFCVPHPGSCGCTVETDSVWARAAVEC